MNGMHQAHSYAYNTGSDPYTVSHHYEVAPISSLVQLSLSSYYEFGDQANVQTGITRVEYIHPGGVPRHNDYSEISEYPTAVAINRMTRVDWELTASACWADYPLNIFYWDSVA